MAKSQTQQTYKASSGDATNALNQQNQYAGQAGAGYGNFAQTGGITPEQQQLTQQQAASGIGSLYGAMKQNLNQRNKVQGGYNPGFGANQAQLARNQSADTSSGVNQATLGLLQQIQQGKLAGLGGLGQLSGMFGQTGTNLMNTSAGLATQPSATWTGIGNAAGVAGSLGF